MSDKLNLWGPALEGYRQAVRPYPLDEPDDSLDEIRAVDVLQRFSHQETGMVVRQWVCALRSGGVLKVSVPDLLSILRDYDAGKEFDVQAEIFGGQALEQDVHHCALDEEALTEVMGAVGLVDIGSWQPDRTDACARLRTLRLQGTKPTRISLVETPAFSPGLQSIYGQLHPEMVTGQDGTSYRRVYGPQEPLPMPPMTAEDRAAWLERCARVRAVMTLPRLAFVDNLFCTLKTFTALGVDVLRIHGVFWGQCLTRGLESAASHGELLFTLDYDTVFTQEDVLRLVWLMDKHPGVDAIAPMQTQREQDVMLFNPSRDPLGQPRTEILLGELQEELVPVRTAHFGLTVVRTSALLKMERPWFWAQPDPGGRWEAGHVDDDMWFWRQWEKAGNTLCMAPGVVVGHAQLMVSWPTPELKTYHQYINKWEGCGKPLDHIFRQGR